MSLTLYNTAKRQKEEFVPIDPAHIRMYVCGPTVYDFAHIGNARPEVVFDVLARLLRSRYPKVTYARNITDVDDKINAAAREQGISIAAITERTTQAFHDHMAALGVLRPDIEPRATGHIPEMIAMIETLIAKGHAYAAEGHVLFQVSSMADYGKLSGRSLDEMIAGARVEVAPYKREPADFILWKPSSPDLPGWDSPWGRGRPGWHIECSAMSEKHLGRYFDIHGGGRDLIFPHHENEVAQSVCSHGQPFVKYWVHNGFVTVNGEKMSKSLGNFRTVRELLAQAPGEAIRLVLLKTHYRQPLDFSDEALKEAKGNLDRWYRALEMIPQDEPGRMDEGVLAALDDDLNTSVAIARIGELADSVFASAKTAPKEAVKAAASLKVSSAILGLLQQDPAAWFKWQPAASRGLSESAIVDLIGRRNAARKAKDYAEADRIRKELAAGGVVLEDKPGGKTEWRRAG